APLAERDRGALGGERAERGARAGRDESRERLVAREPRVDVQQQAGGAVRALDDPALREDEVRGGRALEGLLEQEPVGQVAGQAGGGTAQRQVVLDGLELVGERVELGERLLELLEERTARAGALLQAGDAVEEVRDLASR